MAGVTQFQLLNGRTRDHTEDKAFQLQAKSSKSTRLHRAAFEGDLELVTSLLSLDPSAANVINRNGCTPLHLGAYLLLFAINVRGRNHNCNFLSLLLSSRSALGGRHSEVATLLLQAGSDASLQNRKGRTPLMAAVVAGCPLSMLQLLVDHGADVAVKNYERKSVLDYAAHQKKGDTLAFLKAALAKSSAGATEDIKQERDNRAECPLCGESFRRINRAGFLAGRVARGELSNPYLVRFVESKEVYEPICTNPLYHRVANLRQIRKEATESEAILSAVEGVVGPFSAAYQLIDLCSGKSLTTTIAALRYPDMRCLAIDKLTRHLAPHFEGNAEYAEMDILHAGFPALLGDKLAASEQPAILLGMHLCGILSFRAIELFLEVDRIQVIVLAPCCLPSRKVSTVAVDSGSKDSQVQYDHWCRVLRDRLIGDNMEVTLTQDELIESPRNTIITARKLPGFDRTCYPQAQYTSARRRGCW